MTNGRTFSQGDPYVGAALDLDEALRESWFARPPQELLRPTDELGDAARALRLCVQFREDETAGLDLGDGAPLSFLLRGDAWRAGRFEQRGPMSEAAIWLERS